MNTYLKIHRRIPIPKLIQSPFCVPCPLCIFILWCNGIYDYRLLAFGDPCLTGHYASLRRALGGYVCACPCRIYTRCVLHAYATQGILVATPTLGLCPYTTTHIGVDDSTYVDMIPLYYSSLASHCPEKVRHVVRHAGASLTPYTPPTSHSRGTFLFGVPSPCQAHYDSTGRTLLRATEFRTILTMDVYVLYN